jgi:hypothetical protein
MKQENEIRKFKCGYCKTEFEREIIISKFPKGQNKCKYNLTVPVKCPGCGNFLKVNGK